MAENKTMLKEEQDIRGGMTIRDILTQLTELQKQLTEHSETSLHRLTDTVDSLKEEDPEARRTQITEICAAFEARETTLRMLLEFYRKIYDDIQEEDAAREMIALRYRLTQKKA